MITAFLIVILIFLIVCVRSGKDQEGTDGEAAMIVFGGPALGLIAAFVVGSMLPQGYFETSRIRIVRWEPFTTTTFVEWGGKKVQRDTRSAKLTLDDGAGQFAVTVPDGALWRSGNNEVATETWGFGEGWYWLLGLRVPNAFMIQPERVVVYANDRLMAAKGVAK
jgi:hypothetical protein